MKACILMYVCTFLVCCQSIQKQDSKYVSSAQDALNSTEQIIINGQGSGSAFYLGNNYWGTAKHCVMDMNPNGFFYEITMNGKECKIIVASVHHDIAIFQIDTPDTVKPFKFADSYPELGEIVCSAGWHFGYEETFSIGYLSKYDKDLIVHTAPMNGGVSGGPTMDENFNLIGVNTAILTASGGWNGVSYSAKSHHLKELFEFAQGLK
tara:strand:+ start:3127 stop:3750 length:624 start_codon:yes stop_codon:yes gene_type:complete